MDMTALRRQHEERLTWRGWSKVVVRLFLPFGVHAVASVIPLPFHPVVLMLAVTLAAVVFWTVYKHEDIRSEPWSGIAAVVTCLGIIMFAVSYNDPVIFLRIFSAVCVWIALTYTWMLLKGPEIRSTGVDEVAAAERAYWKISISSALVFLLAIEVAIFVGDDLVLQSVWAMVILVFRPFLSFCSLRTWLNTDEHLE